MLYDLLAAAIGEYAAARGATPQWWPSPPNATALFPTGHERPPAPARSGARCRRSARPTDA
jgi:hypothetical protein